jgi:CDP-4-dehydro-6-deoxyglucose reductase
MFKIYLKNNKSFFCDSDETIINSAIKNNIFLNHSCLLGRCSSCKFKVLNGQSYAIDSEVSLTKKDLDQNFILACVRKPLSDIYLEAEDLSDFELKKPKILPAKIFNFEKMTGSIIRVTLKLPPTQKFEFLEGQYVDIIKGSIKRSYSIANSSSSGVLDFFIKNYDGGLMSNYWFGNLAVNDLLRIEGPKGTFFLRNNQDKNTLVFIATGTGIAPIKSILESESFNEKSKNFKRIFVFWGMRYENEIFWRPDNSRVVFIPVLSRESKKKLYVQDLIDNYNFNTKETVVYACGSDSMIVKVKDKFLNSGLLESDFYSDSFVQSI